MKLYTLILTGLVFFSTSAIAVEKPNPEHVDEVRQRTQEVVPYDVNQTLQIFTKTVHGGVQHVIVKSDDNTEQIKLIQAQLLKMADKFKKGDFSETERIHGADMPGLAQLKLAEPYDIKYEYEALPNGAQIHFSTEYPKYAQALHEWFAAQMNDHNSPVTQEHSKHHSTLAE